MILPDPWNLSGTEPSNRNSMRFTGTYGDSSEQLRPLFLGASVAWNRRLNVTGILTRRAVNRGNHLILWSDNGMG